MKFRRNARLLRSQLDAAPYAAVFFLLVIFMMLGSLIYTPGARLDLRLPEASDVAGPAGPPVSVAIDVDGRLYYQNQGIGEDELRGKLKEAVRKSPEPLTLVVYADKAVKHDQVMRLTLLAREAGIHQALLAGAPGAGTASRP